MSYPRCRKYKSKANSLRMQSQYPWRKRSRNFYYNMSTRINRYDKQILIIVGPDRSKAGWKLDRLPTMKESARAAKFRRSNIWAYSYPF